MDSKFTILSSLLLVSTALAVPSPPLARDNQHSTSDAAFNVTYINDWSGAALSVANVHFNYVVGVIDVPAFSIEHGDYSSVRFSLFVDHLTCTTNSLELGIACNHFHTGSYSLFAFYRWLADAAMPATPIENFRVDPGDQIQANITFSSYNATLQLSNAQTNQMVAFSVSTQAPLCLHDVGWMVLPNGTLPLTKFDNVIFTDVGAQGTDGKNYNLGNAIFTDIQLGNSSVLTYFNSPNNTMIAVHTF